MTMIISSMLSRDALETDAMRLLSEGFDRDAVYMAVDEIVSLANSLHEWRCQLDRRGRLYGPGEMSRLHGRHAEVLYWAAEDWHFAATADALITYGSQAYEDFYRLTHRES